MIQQYAEISQIFCCQHFQWLLFFEWLTFDGENIFYIIFIHIYIKTHPQPQFKIGLKSHLIQVTSKNYFLLVSGSKGKKKYLEVTSYFGCGSSKPCQTSWPIHKCQICCLVSIITMLALFTSACNIFSIVKQINVWKVFTPSSVKCENFFLIQFITTWQNNFNILNWEFARIFQGLHITNLILLIPRNNSVYRGLKVCLIKIPILMLFKYPH